MRHASRHYVLLFHRYSGLFIAGFLILAGISGALLAFHKELDDAFNHRLAYVSVERSTPLAIADLHDKVTQAFPEYGFSSLPVATAPDKSVVFLVDKFRGKGKIDPEPKIQEVFVNPYSGDILGTRDKDAWQWQNAMSKVFWFHRELLLGDLGELVLGVVALLWTINCFIGVYLTWPRAAKNGAKKRASAVKRWLPTWKIRTKTNTFKLNYDIHQAFGLWLWVMFFVIAWSSVGFNLKSVYRPVMKVAIGLEAKDKRQDKNRNNDKKVDKTNQFAKNRGNDNEDNRQALSNDMPTNDKSYIVTKANSIDYLSQKAASASQNNGVKMQTPLGLRWDSEAGSWQLRFKTDHDIGQKGGASSITVDAKSGAVVRTHFGNESSTAEKADQWLSALHMGHISSHLGHLLYQLFLAVAGLLLAVMSGAGVYLWYQSRLRRLRA